MKNLGKILEYGKTSHTQEVRRMTIVFMTILPKVIYKFAAISINILHRKSKAILKFTRKHKWVQLVKAILTLLGVSPCLTLSYALGNTTSMVKHTPTAIAAFSTNGSKELCTTQKSVPYLPHKKCNSNRPRSQHIT